MSKHTYILALSLLLIIPTSNCVAQARGKIARRTVSHEKDLHLSSNWIPEAEDPATSVEWHEGVAELRSPKGLTLWYKPELRGDIVIEYDAMVLERVSTDRLSDLNCFWMASDPSAPAGSIWYRLPERSGIFRNCYSLQLYYVGFGGNSNTTTRFRRYDGKNPSPSILSEFIDKNHLLKANIWYHIRLENTNGKVRYTINGETLVDYQDPSPFTHGWFGLRTTWSHILFKPTKIEEKQ